MVSINRQMATGAAWMVGLRMFHRGIGFISTLILARLLVPADFGLVAMATVLMQFLVAVSDFSVHVPLIQKTSIDREDMDSAWSLQAALGVAQAVILLALAHPAADFYNEPRLVFIVYVLALIALLKGLKNIGVVMFQRDMTFGRDFKLMATQRLAMFVVTIAIAWTYQTYWALVAGMVVGAIAELSLSYLMHPFRPRFSRKRWGEIFTISKWLLANNILNFLANRGPDLVLGRWLGPRAVGLFSIGYEIAMLPSTELVAPINRAALPGYSRLRDTPGGLQQGYLDVIGLIALVAMPAAVGIAASAELLIPLLLGSNWYDAIPVVHYLALTGAVGVLMTNNGAVFMALGVPRIITFLLVSRISFLIPGFVVGISLAGVTGVAIAYFAVELVFLVINTGVLLSIIELPAARYLRTINRPVIGCLVMYATLTYLVVPWLLNQTPMGKALASVVCVATGAGVYACVVLFLFYAQRQPVGAEARALRWIVECLPNRR